MHYSAKCLELIPVPDQCSSDWQCFDSYWPILIIHYSLPWQERIVNWRKFAKQMKKGGPIKLASKLFPFRLCGEKYCYSQFISFLSVNIGHQQWRKALFILTFNSHVWKIFITVPIMAISVYYGYWQLVICSEHFPDMCTLCHIEHFP